MTPALKRLSELLTQPERPAVDVIAQAVQGYLLELAETYGKPSITWHNPVPERIALLVAAALASKERKPMLDTLFQMCAREHLPSDQLGEWVADDLEFTAGELARAWREEMERAA